MDSETYKPIKEILLTPSDILLQNNNDNDDGNNPHQKEREYHSWLSDPERIGMLLVCCSTFFQSFNSFYTKLIQLTYPTIFHTIPFLFYRGITIMIIASLRAYIYKERILYPKEIPEKKWFFLRTNMNFLGVSCMTMSIWYLRSSTAQILSSLNPVIVLVLSYFILKEKFYFRYVIGFCSCILGSTIIILNERQAKKPIVTSSSFGDTLKGVLFGLIGVCTISLINISNKILVRNKVPINTQLLYSGISTLVYSSIYILVFGIGEAQFGYVAMCMSHGFGFFAANLLYNLALQRAPLSKLIILTYLKIVYIYLLSFVFLHESIFFSDMIGAGIILGYMCYNAYYPLPKDDESH